MNKYDGELTMEQRKCLELVMLMIIFVYFVCLPLHLFPKFPNRVDFRDNQEHLSVEI